MKRMFKSIALLAIVLAAAGIVSGLSAQDKKEKAPKTETMKCWVSMSCENCKAKVEKNIPFEKGVTALSVDLPTKMVTITYKKGKTTPEKLEKALQDLGYKTEIIKE